MNVFDNMLNALLHGNANSIDLACKLTDSEVRSSFELYFLDMMIINDDV